MISTTFFGHFLYYSAKSNHKGHKAHEGEEQGFAAEKIVCQQAWQRTSWQIEEGERFARRPMPECWISWLS
jgi:hypothetical protein